MRTKILVSFSLICVLSMVLIAFQPVTAQTPPYHPGLQPSTFSSPELHWRVTNVTEEVVEFGFGSGNYWHTRAGQEVTFTIHQLANNELHGLFTIGNLTLPANDSRIAAELVFSIWPWFPGLVSHLDWTTVDQEATNAAMSFYMNGSLEIITTSTTKSYIYHQGPWGNQNTTVVYDLTTGILLAGYTEFFFLNDYHLGIEFLILTQSPTELATPLFAAVLVLVMIIIAFSFAIVRKNNKKS